MTPNTITHRGVPVSWSESGGSVISRLPLAFVGLQLTRLIRDLLADAVRTGDLRDDIAPGELATYCIHALAAARTLPSKAAVRRLVAVTLAGLRPPV